MCSFVLNNLLLHHDEEADDLHTEARKLWSEEGKACSSKPLLVAHNLSFMSEPSFGTAELLLVAGALCMVGPQLSHGVLAIATFTMTKLTKVHSWLDPTLRSR